MKPTTFGTTIMLKTGHWFDVSSPHQEWTDRFAPQFRAAPELIVALENMLSCYRAGDRDSMANAVTDAEALLAK